MTIAKRGAEATGRAAGAEAPLVPALATFKVAAAHLGAASANALRMRFDRGTYPRRFVVQLTPSKPGVDLHAVLAWIRRGSREEREAV